MSSLLIAVPVLGRPANAAPLVASALEATPEARILFLCSPGDDAEIAACRATGADVDVVPWRAGPGDWARKLNRAIRGIAEEWMLLGADDLVFHPGWFEACMREARRTDACMVGTNDMGNARVIAGNHSTHPLVHRDYIFCGTVDEDDKILCELYDHQFVDDEAVQTARVRGVYVHAHDARVEHRHPNWGKAADDATYQKGMAHLYDDQRLYHERCGMWLRPRQPLDRRRG